MATKELLAQLKLRKDTAANWTEQNPILGNGEMIIVETSSGEQRFKLGDGEKTFTQLPYTDETLLSKIKTYSAGDGINITDDGVISSNSDVFVIEVDIETGETIISDDFDKIKDAIQNKKALMLHAGESMLPIQGTYSNDTDVEGIYLCVNIDGIFIKWYLTRESGANNVIQGVKQYDMPFASADDSPASGAAYWNATKKKWEIKDITSDSATGSSSSAAELCAEVTLGEKDTSSSIGEWVLVYPGTVANSVTYDQALAAFNNNTPVKIRITSTKTVNGVTIPIISEAYMTRYIAAQNALIFDYVHNATDLSVSSGGIVWTSDGTITCYTATYSFAFGSNDTSATSVQVPTTTKVQDMIDAAVSNIDTSGAGGLVAGGYTIQVSNVAPAAGTASNIITYVVEGA